MAWKPYTLSDFLKPVKTKKKGSEKKKSD